MFVIKNPRFLEPKITDTECWYDTAGNNFDKNLMHGITNVTTLK